MYIYIIVCTYLPAASRRLDWERARTLISLPFPSVPLTSFHSTSPQKETQGFSVLLLVAGIHLSRYLSRTSPGVLIPIKKTWLSSIIPPHYPPTPTPQDNQINPHIYNVTPNARLACTWVFSLYRISPFKPASLV